MALRQTIEMIWSVWAIAGRSPVSMAMARAGRCGLRVEFLQVVRRVVNGMRTCPGAADAQPSLTTARMSGSSPRTSANPLSVSMRLAS